MDTAHPRHTWVPYVAGLAGAAFLLKTTLAIAGHNGVEAGPIFGVLYLSGLALGVAAAIGTGLRRKSVGARIAVAVALTFLLLEWILGIGDALKPLIGAFTDAENVKVEVPVGIAGVVLLLLAYIGYSRDQDAVRREAVEHDRAQASPTM